MNLCAPFCVRKEEEEEERGLVEMQQPRSDHFFIIHERDDIP